MPDQQIDLLRHEITDHQSNRHYREQGIGPLFVASAQAKIVIIGQAPGVKAQASMIAWGDASGLKLMDWLGVDEATFRDPSIFALIPMDFYYPGKGKSGDAPPRKDFAGLWHPRLLASMPDLALTILIGSYAQAHYLHGRKMANLTETVRVHQSYLPQYFPLVHPSPLNFRWQAKNPWFTQDTIPALRRSVHDIITPIDK